MAPTIKWQRWDSASYNWFGVTTSDALPALEAELDAWITAVNGNASNAGRSITKERGYASSTTVNYAGLVISAGANGNASKGYMSYYTHGSTSTRRVYLGDTYSNDTANGGYGTISGGRSDTSVSWVTSGREASWLIVSDVTDGFEYFCFGPSIGTSTTTSYMNGFFIFKGTDGEWTLETGDSSNRYVVHYFDDAAGSGWDTPGRGVNTTCGNIGYDENYVSSRYSVFPKTTPGGSSADSAIDGAYYVFCNNSDVYNAVNERTGSRRVLTDLGTGDNVYQLSGYYYGPQFLVDLRS